VQVTIGVFPKMNCAQGLAGGTFMQFLPVR
jgi:hypothetical protein